MIIRYQNLMCSDFRLGSYRCVNHDKDIFYFYIKNINGAGRIRTSDLQRPRLASCQARQRPQDCTDSGCNPYYMSINVLAALDLNLDYLDLKERCSIL